MFRVILHYRRMKKDYKGWGLHVWGPTLDETAWNTPLMPMGEDEYGIFWVVRMAKGAEVLNYIIHRGEEKDYWQDQQLNLIETGREVWLIESTADTPSPHFTNPEEAIYALAARGVGDIRNQAQAYWLTRDTIAWYVGYGYPYKYQLHYAPEGGILASAEGVKGGWSIPLLFAERSLSPLLVDKFPHLRHTSTFKIPQKYLELVPEMLKGQVIISMSSIEGEVFAVSALQIPGVLDDLYTYHGKLGVSFQENIPTLRLWAPTARSVLLHLYRCQSDNQMVEYPSSPIPMKWKEESGTWEIQGEPSWIGLYYLYEIFVYVRQQDKIIHTFVTDPYSISLAVNSKYSQIIDLNNPELFPQDWHTTFSNQLSKSNQPIHPADMAIYELHLRDFSAFDESVPEEKRGTYLAFTCEDSFGMKHLKRIAAAGITHIHFLPLFDFATVDEDRSTWASIDPAQLSSLPPESDRQQQLISQIVQKDGYNWGYDPFHFFAPEGSYALEPQGEKRILEFRQMISALKKINLGVIMDVVFNHTYAADLEPFSVLDRIVPGYYHRLDKDGLICTSTCCPNLATEHAMMEKLMIDAVKHWAIHYKIEGFRFDLMGHHLKSNMLNLRAALDQLTIEKDGVDGKHIYLYGEGWNFGEMAHNARGINATQWNMQGTGIGTFNDRLREAVRGGGPFGNIREQGFVTGLYIDPNEDEHRPLFSQLAKLLDLTDRIRLGLAGNLAEYEMMDHKGFWLSGAQVSDGCGYTRDPQENVVYVSAHDNETLFDCIQLKAPLNLKMDERVRMQNLAISIVALAQGVPFFHAGCELLRSKSLDRDSYNSGDWFNRLDYSYQTNNWGVGLPMRDKNETNWNLMRKLLSNSNLCPSNKHISACLYHFEEMLRIRKSSPLFRLRYAGEIMNRVKFLNTGPNQLPALIIMQLIDDIPMCLDNQYDSILVFFNAHKIPQAISLASEVTGMYSLHPIQVRSRDEIVRRSTFDEISCTFYIPARTCAVFVRKRLKKKMP